MCGIAGYYGRSNENDRDHVTSVFSDLLKHRGPDGVGFYHDNEINFIHRRLSIIDLSEHGNQPQYNEDRSVVLICNGEIYNYIALRNELIASGHKFSSNSDCEVILHLYEEYRDYPDKLLNKLTGMFAFAIWDIKEQKLFIARDRMGIKPLYYYHNSGKLTFCSEVKPLAIVSGVDTNIDHTSLYEYFLTGSIPAPNTLYKGIRSLEPGHYLSIQNDRLKINSYWDIPLSPKRWESENEVLEFAGTLLTTIIKDHLVADVPVGAFLSAGIDSSLITAIAAELHPGIHTFTASFPGEPEDEGTIADSTAKLLGTTHHASVLNNNFFADLPEQFLNIDQPFAISSALSLGRISKLARKEVKVVLSGDGGDELFGGYHRHEIPVLPRFLKNIPPSFHQSFLRFGALMTGKKSLLQLRKNIARSNGNKFLDKTAVAMPSDAIKFFDPDIIREIDEERYLHRIETFFNSRDDKDVLNRLLYVDMKTTLVDEMLTKCDRMTMINGIEGRVPFLDHRFVEFAFSVPAEFKRKDGSGKLVLRKLTKKKLGAELAYRVKTGFNSPLKQWIKNDNATRDFVVKEFIGCKKLNFLNTNIIDEYIADPARYSTASIMSLVCLGDFMNRCSKNFI